MNNLLTRLESTENILLLYLSGELARPDQAKVQSLLEHDPAWQAEFERLGHNYATAERHLRAADAASGLNEQRACERTLAAMRQWHSAAAQRKHMVIKPAAGLPLPWWCYPLAAAASILLAFSVWLANVKPSAPVQDTSWALASPPEWGTEEAAGVAMVTLETLPMAEQLALSFDDSDVALNDAYAQDGMVEAARELESLRQAADHMSTL